MLQVTFQVESRITIMSKKTDSGFTVVELIVAVMGVAVVGLVAVVTYHFIHKLW